ncbi:MAG: TonB-dependent receptor [Verrucomicrobiota bacterium]|nr:TonB-dependent receptor [Verrucomicrobiota bacterium]
MLFSNEELGDEQPIYQLEDFVVSAGPVARSVDDYAVPVTTLDTSALRRKSSTTLGELLDGQPGVSASSFGGAVSRPIIRGFDGSRVAILESGLGTGDVSETSPDHAVTIEPLLTKRVEVLRGPGTLLYGSNAIGGVVNVVGRELPREQPNSVLSGSFEARHDTVSDGETTVGYTTFSEGPLVVTVQGLERQADDYEIPSHPESVPDEPQEGDTLGSSFVETDFYSVGASWFFNEQNYLGFSVSKYDSFYGISGHEHHHEDEPPVGGAPVVEEEEEEIVALDLERSRFDAELAVFEPTQWIEAIRVRFGYTDYKHVEGSDDEATTFERESWELRAEATHSNWSIFSEGIFGVQFNDADFQATGDEIAGVDGGAAFGPPSTTRSQAFFFSEKISNNGSDLYFDVGGRVENQKIEADGASNYSDAAISLGFSSILNIDKGKSLALSLQRTERHPNATELYSNGPHMATSQYQTGDETLEKETAYGVDLTYRHRKDKWEATASVFYTYFENYIFDEFQGNQIDDEGRRSNGGIGGAPEVGFEEDHALNEYNYVAADALFYGFEAELDYIAYRAGDTTVRIGVLADYVVAENRDNNDNLPRIPPFRLGGKAELEYGNWNAGVLLRRSYNQNDTAPDDLGTDGFTELETDLSYSYDLGNGMLVTAFARANNLLDEEIRHHTSFIKDKAPRPGRNFTIGARVEF